MMPESSPFIKEIEELVWDKDVSYIDAVVLWCERHSIEVETVAETVKKDPVLKSKIEAEAASMFMLKTDRPTQIPLAVSMERTDAC